LELRLVPREEQTVGRLGTLGEHTNGYLRVAVLIVLLGGDPEKE
jgi:hypothetical protein